MTPGATGVTPAWRALLDATYNHDDDTWDVGEGGDLLLNVIIELMHPPPEGEPAVTEDQLAAALERAK